MRHAYLIELKYLSRTQDSPQARRDKLAEAQTQLRRYRQDERVTATLGHAQLHCLTLLYSGWELVVAQELSPDLIPSRSL